MTAEAQHFQGLGIRQRPVNSARRMLDPEPESFVRTRARAEAAFATPFVGITTDGSPVPGLFPLQKTGVSTQPIRAAAERFLALLSPEQRGGGSFPIDSLEWRKWINAEHYVFRADKPCLDDMNEAQCEAAFDLLRSTLSPHGFETARNIMKLNGFMGDIANDHENLSEWLYFFSVFGTPSETEAWGWQIDGHHLIVNCFVLGDQITITPAFMGAEPTFADRGPYAGIRVFEEEQRNGLAVVRSLDQTQEEQAVIFRSTLSTDLPPERYDRGDGRHQGGAFRDNQVLPYEGVCADALSGRQKDLLLQLIETYAGRMRAGHAEVKMAEVRHHLEETYFAWMGSHEDDSVFYYKIHSPVILIEFDHHRGIFLDVDEPVPFHIHTIVRTPNGNDYGKDLLRQHYERFHRS